MKYDRIMIHRYTNTEPCPGTESVSLNRAPCSEAFGLVSPVEKALGKQQRHEDSAGERWHKLVREGA